MEKINPLQTFDEDETTLKHLQVIFLNENNFQLMEIAKWTGYKIQTIKKYIKQFAHLLEEAKQTFKRITKKNKTEIARQKTMVLLV